jgi:hypothetical protein
MCDCLEVGRQASSRNQAVDIWRVDGPDDLVVGVILHDDDEDMIERRHGGSSRRQSSRRQHQHDKAGEHDSGEPAAE